MITWQKSGFSERGFVSPIASNALQFYQYELVGSSQQNGELVHKIRVTPRRRLRPGFFGLHLRRGWLVAAALRGFAAR
ncbi:MAG: DUF5686 family protein [Hymenobacter sp.]